MATYKSIPKTPEEYEKQIMYDADTKAILADTNLSNFHINDEDINSSKNDITCDDITADRIKRIVDFYGVERKMLEEAIEKATDID